MVVTANLAVLHIHHGDQIAVPAFAVFGLSGKHRVQLALAHGQIDIAVAAPDQAFGEVGEVRQAVDT